MRLVHNVKDISRLLLILLLLISFIVGAFLSYIWTMGYYAPQEFHLPKQANIAIESVQFSPDDATSFNVTVLNPSYSSDVKIEQIEVETADGNLHEANFVGLHPFSLARGALEIIECVWDWGNYTGQTFKIIMFLSDGSGATVKANIPLSVIKFRIVSVNFDPSVSVEHFNITVQNAGSLTFVDITKILVNYAEVSTVPTLTSPYRLSNASDAPPVTFMVMGNWADLEDTTVTIEVQSLQGYSAHRNVNVPSVKLFNSIIFNAADPSHFNATVYNDAASAAKVDITQVKVQVLGANVTITDVSPALPQPLQPGSDVLLQCSWDWSSYQGQSATVTVTVQTLQGFTVSQEATIP